MGALRDLLCGRDITFSHVLRGSNNMDDSLSMGTKARDVLIFDL